MTRLPKTIGDPKVQLLFGRLSFRSAPLRGGPASPRHVPRHRARTWASRSYRRNEMIRIYAFIKKLMVISVPLKHSIAFVCSGALFFTRVLFWKKWALTVTNRRWKKHSYPLSLSLSFLYLRHFMADLIKENENNNVSCSALSSSGWLAQVPMHEKAKKKMVQERSLHGKWGDSGNQPEPTKLWLVGARCRLHNRRCNSIAFPVVQAVQGQMNQSLAKGAIQPTKRTSMHYGSLDRDLSVAYQSHPKLLLESIERAFDHAWCRLSCQPRCSLPLRRRPGSPRRQPGRQWPSRLSHGVGGVAGQGAPLLAPS